MVYSNSGTHRKENERTTTMTFKTTCEFVNFASVMTTKVGGKTQKHKYCQS